MTSIAPKRFVILHHHVGSGVRRTDQDHFDWMFQTGPKLTTFATSVMGDMNTVFDIECHRLPDHRIEYLHFEGPIPDRGKLRNRGSVRRVVSGTFEEIKTTPDFFSATLSFDSANKKMASVEFRQRDQQHWSLRFVP